MKNFDGILLVFLFDFIILKRRIFFSDKIEKHLAIIADELFDTAESNFLLDDDLLIFELEDIRKIFK